MRTLRLLLLCSLLTLLSSACKAPAATQLAPEPRARGGGPANNNSDDATDPKTFLEYVIIESRIECLNKVLAADAEGQKKAGEAILAHHGVDMDWLISRRELAKTDMKKAHKAKLLFEEARSSVCPAGKPDPELAQIVGELAAAAPAAENGE